MQYGLDFTVEPLKKRSHGNGARLKPFYAKEAVMDSKKRKFKHSEEMRKYWRLCKSKERAREVISTGKTKKRIIHG